MGDIEAHESRLYSDFAPLYDKIFGKIFYSRLERVIDDLEIPSGAKVSEVGAGTGTSFPAFQPIARSRVLTWLRTCWPEPVRKFERTVGRTSKLWR